MDVPGADLLMNTSAMAAANTKLPEMESVNLDFTDLPSEPAAPPRLNSAAQQPLPTDEVLEATVLPTPRKTTVAAERPTRGSVPRSPQKFNNLLCSPRDFGFFPAIY